MKKSKMTSVVCAVAASIVCIMPMAACSSDPVNYDDGLTVTIDYNDNYSRPGLLFADADGKVEAPDTPTTAGHTFDKWTSDKDGNTPVTFPLTITESTTVYAQWKTGVYNVSFDWCVAGAQPVVVQKEYNATLEKSEAPTAAQAPTNSGKYFFDWVKKEGGDASTVVNFPVTVTNNTTYYAYWIDESLKPYTLKFHANYDGADELSDQRVIKGEKGRLPDIGSSRPGWKLMGWATTATGKVKYTGTTVKPTADMELYAIWEKAKYNIFFRTNYYNAASPDHSRGTYEYGDEVAKPATDPTRPGYKFIGWYSSNMGGEKLEFPQIARTGTSFYAHWEVDAVESKTFDAEYVAIDPNEKFRGYSGDAIGWGIITPDNGRQNASTVAEAGATDTATNGSYYVTYLYKRNASLKFVFNSDRAVTGATLYAKVAIENQKVMTFAPTGDYAVKFLVNGTPLDYGSISFNNEPNVGTVLYASAFKEVHLGSINLKEGENEIELLVDNAYAEMGGTMKAAAFMIDNIRINTDATLTWHPQYDNLRVKFYQS